ncbi:hypothetical protein MBLNU457_5897t1 [Dothideomycetes sp. NU457]
MADERAPQNRRKRRAAAKEKGEPFEPLTAANIPMAQPDWSRPKGKTLYDLAAEREELLRKGQPFDKEYDVDEEGNVLDSEPPIGPVGDAFIFTLTLGMLHFTLDVLVYNQYRQTIEWKEIITRTATMLPVLFVVTFVLRSKTLARWPLLKQMVCFQIGAVAGSYLICIGNTFGYYAVMKQSPPVGTLWVLAVIEMRLPFAVASVTVNGAFLWWYGYKVF